MTAPKQIRPLTSIRAFAALWVVVMHFDNEFTALIPAWTHVGWLTSAGARGVDLFFVLSGFILCYNYAGLSEETGSKSFFRFLWLRLARIYPAYLAAIVVMVLFVATARHWGLPITADRYPTSVLIPEVLMTHMWSWRSYRIGWNVVDWSVSAEWFAYLFIFPLAVFLLARIKAARWQIFLTATLLAALSLPWPGNRTGWTQLPPPVVMVSLEFLAGGMIYGLRRQWLAPSGFLLNLLFCLTVGIIVSVLAFPTTAGLAGRPILVACFGLLILVLSYGAGAFSTLFSGWLLVYCGEISYSLYLTHEIVLRVLKVILHPDRFAQLPAQWRVLYFLVYWVMIFGAAAALYHVV